MRKLAIFLLLALMIGIVGTAQVNAAEFTTLQIVNELLRLQGEAPVADLAPYLQSFETYAQGHFTITGYGKQAGYDQQAYAYKVSDGSTINLGAYTGNTLGTLLGAGNIQFDPTGAWGLEGVTTGGTFFSQAAKNTDDQSVHWKLYCITPSDNNGISIGFAAYEDLAKNVSDFDYNDLVLKIEPNPNPNAVPLPGGLLLLGAGLGRLAAYTRRRK